MIYFARLRTLLAKTSTETRSDRKVCRDIAASVFALLAGALSLTGCGSGPLASSTKAVSPDTIHLEGKVHGGQQPIVGATIQLLAAGTTADKSAATPLIASTVLTGAAGDFSITGLYTCPTIQSEVYLIASGGNPGLAPGTNNTASVLMSALGPCGNLSSSTHIVINEVSTIGSIYPITPFMSSFLNVGSSPANFNTMAADFMQINQFINTDGGQSPGPTLPAGFSAPVTNLYTLANSMAACINSTGGVAGDGSNCGNFLLFAKPPAGSAPTNTADAILDIANNPTNNVSQIFSLSSASPAFQPSLSSAPADWSLKILPNIMLATASNLVGVGSTNTGTITLGQAAPAGGLTISFVSDNPGFVSVVSPVTIPAGATTGTFSYTGVAAGTANISGSGTGYVTGTAQVSATASLISLGTIPTVAPGQQVDLPLSLGTPAPVGGVTINFSSTNTGVATISPLSVTIAAGLKVPTSNPKVMGVTIGSATINATASAFAPGSRAVTVSVTASLPTNLTVPLTTPTNETLTISAPAPAGGITFNLLSDNTGVFTVPATITVPAGSTTVNIPITGIAPGTSTLHANSTGIPEATSSITVNGTIGIQSATVLVGKQLQTSTYFTFGATPASPTTGTITSSNPAVAIVSASPTVLGGTTATISAITNTSANFYYIQGVGVGSATVTVSATGYASSTVNVTVDPSGFVIYSPGSIATTTLSPNTAVNIEPAILNPATSAVLGYSALAPMGNVSVPVLSSNPAAGTIVSSPITFTANDSNIAASFQPASTSGTTNISITQPAGFTTPTPSTTQLITATVSAPPITVQSATITTGANLEVSTYFALSQTPLVPTTVTITSSNPAVAVVSASPTVAGTGTASLTSIVNSSADFYYIQGLSTGTSTLTISASPYTSSTVTVTVDPSGFIIYSPGSINTTSFSASSSVNIEPAILNPATLAVIGYASINPQISGVSVPFVSSIPAVGTITTPVVFHSGDSNDTATFQPVSAGSTNLTITQPAGFTTPTPSATQQITATVTAPPLVIQTANITTGASIQASTYVALSQTPPTPTLITVTSDTPAVATISTSATIAGGASTTFPNVVNTSANFYYIQGQTVGTAHITVSAPGYQSATVTVTVDPSGFVIYSPGSITTTTFSTASSINIEPAILNPTTFTVIGYGQLNPGISTISVAMNSSATQVGTITSPAIFHGGDSNVTVSFQPVAAGNSTLSIVSQPAGFTTPSPSSTQQIPATVTAPNLIVQSGNYTVGLNLEGSTYGALSVTPPSPVTLTITSNDPTIAVLSTSPTVVGGTTLTFPNLSNTNAQFYWIQGLKLGTTTLTLSAPGYSNATVNVTVNPSGFVIYSPGSFSTTTFSTATSINIEPVILSPGTLLVQAYATLSPGVGSVVVPLNSSTPTTGTISASATFNAGDSNITASFQPANAGTSTLSISGTPAGFSTPSSAATQQITATVTAPPLVVQTANLVTGLGLEVSTYGALSVTPPSAVALTITSNNPAIAVISKSVTVAGTASLSFTSLANTSAQFYWVQGLATGSTTLTLQAPGYQTATVNVTVNPAGFVIYSPGSFSTTTFSSPTAINIEPAILNSGVLTLYGYATVSPGFTASVPITSSIPGVGTVTTPVVFNAGDSNVTATFQPVSAGSTVLSLGAVAGFTTSSQSSNQQLTATVTAPPISVQNANPITGANLQISTYAALGVTAPSPVTLTITSNNPAIALISTSATTVGTSSISFPGITTTSAQFYYLQGVAVGSTTLTVSAPGYQTTTVNVTVDPSGFVIYSPGNFNTSVGAADTTINIEPAVLNPGVLTVNSYAALSPGAGTVTVPVGSTSLAIGTVSPTSLFFTANTNNLTTNFHPLSTGQTDVVIVNQPAGFTTPSQTATQQIVINVQ